MTLIIAITWAENERNIFSDRYNDDEEGDDVHVDDKYDGYDDGG